MIKSLLSACLVLCLSLSANAPQGERETLSAEESLFLRRIAEFWEEGEISIAKTQIVSFLEAFPQSSYADDLHICLGDLLLREKEYAGALNRYAEVKSPERQEEIFLRRMQALYHLQWHATLIDECEAALCRLTDREKQREVRYYLAAVFYQRCCACQDAERKRALAQKAIVHFDILAEEQNSPGISLALAHLSTLTQEGEKAKALYQKLSEQEPTFAIDASCDFETMIQHVAVAFELGKYEEILEKQDIILNAASDREQGMPALFIGQSALFLQKYPEAIAAFRKASLEEATRQDAFALLLETAHRSKNRPLAEEVLGLISLQDHSFSSLALKGRRILALFYEQEGDLAKAREEIAHLLDDYPDSADSESLLLEQIRLDFARGFWELSHAEALSFLLDHPQSSQSFLAWRSLAASSQKLAQQEPRWEAIFSADVEKLLEQKHLFASEEICDWQFHLAYSYFQRNLPETAISLLQPLVQEECSFPQKANAALLLGLCYREQDPKAFYLYARQAASLGCTLIAPRELQIALFNASLLDPSHSEAAQEHLYEALLAGACIAEENLLWLADALSAEAARSACAKTKVEKILSSLLENTSDPECQEHALYKLASLAFSWRESERFVSYAEKLEALYASCPSQNWRWEQELFFLCAKHFQNYRDNEKALSYLSRIVEEKKPIRSEIAARAFLEKGKILTSQNALEDKDQAASLFKTLILQKNLAYEPVHLEAALLYVDCRARSGESKISLLERMKEEFTSTEDLLSRDYQQARTQYPEKNEVYQQYILFFNAMLQKERALLAVDPCERESLGAEALTLWNQAQKEITIQELIDRMSLEGALDANASSPQ